MSGTHPASKPDWTNLEVIHRGTLPPRSYFFPYDSEAAAIKADRDSSCSLNLSGTWKFHHANSPFTAPQGFEQPAYNISDWSDIRVPGHWQLQGWGAPHYTNFNYIIPVDPPNVPFDDNQTGSYIKKFTLPAAFEDQECRLRFEGVDSAFHVYLNGTEIGYSQGSRNAHEFDVTSHLNKSGENTLAVRVYQWSDASYIEDQDQWRMSGIFRDVLLVAFPIAHVEDFHVQTLLDDKYQDAELQVTVRATGAGDVGLQLLDSSGALVTTDTKKATNGHTAFSLHVQDPKKWTAESPNLYKLVLAYNGRFISQNVGFRRIEIVDGIYKVNGKRIVFRGANRHEHHPEHGRAVPYEFMKEDLLIMKRHNINAIRTCHQPSDPRLYSLADELGFWIMDEADLECHGFGTVEITGAMDYFKDLPEDSKYLAYENAARWTSDNPEWKDQYVDRAVQLVHRDKNHPSVIMWSLGNEAFYGRNHQSMYDEIKKLDKSRPVHYEGDREAKSADLFSYMYSSVDNIIERAQEKNFTKPVVLCEFIHAMGNGPGNIKEYIEAFYKYPRLQGGWVWEWANHGLVTKDKTTGQEYMAYGGDFGDEPNDYNFILDGVLFSNHTPTPGLTEYSKAIEPVQVLSHDTGKVTIINRYDVISLDHLTCQALLIGDGLKKPLGPIDIPAGIAPHTESALTLPELDLSDHNGDVYLELSFSLTEDSLWASAGHVVGTSQLQLKAPHTLSLPLSTSANAPPAVTQTSGSLQVATASTSATFSLANGRLTSLLKHGVEHLHPTLGGPQLTLFRAMTDNDRPQDGQDWLSSRVQLAREHMRSMTWSTSEEGSTARVVVTGHLAPVVLSWALDTETTYTFAPSGVIHISTKLTPRGLHLPPTLPRIGFELGLPVTFDSIDWFGRGPGESYLDKKESQHFGNWSATVDELWTDYEFPQEGGNRTDVRWVRFSPSNTSAKGVVEAVTQRIGALLSSSDSISTPSSSDRPGLTARFGAANGFSFNASRYTSADVEAAKHPYQLREKKKDFVVVRLDAFHHGIGTGSCGPKTLDQYALKVQEGKAWEFELVLE